jgi:ankyrin repeat protein
VVPATISKVLFGMMQQLTDAPPLSQLPGTYPTSSSSTISNSKSTYVTADSTSWWTASGSDWITAIEYVTTTGTGKGDQTSTIVNFMRSKPPKSNSGWRNSLWVATRTRSQNLALRTAIVRAIEREDVDLIIELLEKGIDLSFNERCRGDEPLYSALDCGNDTILRLLLDAGADLPTDEVEGDTLLHWAFTAPRFHPNIVEMLLEAGLRPSPTSSHGETPVHFVMRLDPVAHDVTQFHGSLRTLLQYDKYMLDYPSKLDGRPLQIAIAAFNPENIIFLLNEGADCTFKLAETGETVLHLLLDSKYRNARRNTLPLDYFLKVLILFGENGVNLGARREKDGKTIFHLALDHEPEILECLLHLDNTAVSRPDAFRGNTPLHAILDALDPPAEHPRLVWLLINAGANLSARSWATDRTPLLLACANTSIESSVVNDLILAGADVQVQDDAMETPLSLIVTSMLPYIESYPSIDFDIPEEWSEISLSPFHQQAQRVKNIFKRGYHIPPSLRENYPQLFETVTENSELGGMLSMQSSELMSRRSQSNPS